MKRMMTKTRALPFRWRKVPAGYNSESYDLRRGGIRVAAVARAPAGGWYSYNGEVPVHWNTVASPCGLEEAKADALYRARRALQENEHGR